MCRVIGVAAEVRRAVHQTDLSVRLIAHSAV